MERYQIIKPEMSETLRVIGKTNEERAHELSISYINYRTEMGRKENLILLYPEEYYDLYQMNYEDFLSKLERRNAK